VTEHVVSLTRITGESMTPTFNPDYNKDPLHSDIVVMDKRTGKYRRGDVVTLW
jgi:signal peptidase I